MCNTYYPQASMYEKYKSLTNCLKNIPCQEKGKGFIVSYSYYRQISYVYFDI